MSKSRSSAGAAIVAEARLPTRFGEFRIFGIRSVAKSEEAVAVARGFPALSGAHPNGARTRRAPRADERGQVPLVRIHSQCLTGDVFGSRRCDCRGQLELALQKIAKARCGVLLYLPQEGRGIGLMNKIKAYELQDQGLDTVEANRSLGFAADLRDYEFAADALKALGIRRVRLLSNNPDKVRQLERAGVHVLQRVPCRPRTTSHTRDYLRAKKRKLGHLLSGI